MMRLSLMSLDRPAICSSSQPELTMRLQVSMGGLRILGIHGRNYKAAHTPKLLEVSASGYIHVVPA